MSTITLDANILSTLTAPVNTYLPAPIDPVLLATAKLVNSGAFTPVATIAPEAGIYADPSIAAQRTPRQPKADKSADKKADKNLRKTKNGGMMSTVPGSITKGQLDKLIALADSMGEPMEAWEITSLKAYSMADASDYRYDILNG